MAGPALSTMISSGTSGVRWIAASSSEGGAVDGSRRKEIPIGAWEPTGLAEGGRSADSIALQVGPWSCGSIQYGCSALTGDYHGWQSGSLITIRMGGSPGPCRRGHLSHRRWKKHRTYGQPLPPVLLTPRQRNTKARKTTKARTRHAYSVTRYAIPLFVVFSYFRAFVVAVALAAPAAPLPTSTARTALFGVTPRGAPETTPS